MTNFFFGRYWPKLFRGLHKLCCERILRRFRLFQAKKKFFQNWQFFDFLAYPGSQISWKTTNFFFERYRPEICRDLLKWCCERILRRFRFSSEKKFCSKVAIFLNFFAYLGSHVSWKMTDSFFERCGFEIDRRHHKLCYERILRHFRLFGKIDNILKFFAYPGSQVFLKMTSSFFDRYGSEIELRLLKFYLERKSRYFRLFWTKKISRFFSTTTFPYIFQ